MTNFLTDLQAVRSVSSVGTLWMELSRNMSYGPSLSLPYRSALKEKNRYPMLTT